MKVIILAGGKGTRISEYTKTIPKPMIKIGKKPILIHIIEHYLKQVIKAIAYDNVILFPMDKVINKQIEELKQEEKLKNKDKHEDETTV